MDPKKITPVEVKVVSYMLDNSICIDLIGGDEILKFSPSDVLDMFYGLLQAIGVKKHDELYCAIDDVLTAPPMRTMARPMNAATPWMRRLSK